MYGLLWEDEPIRTHNHWLRWALGPGHTVIVLLAGTTWCAHSGTLLLPSHRWHDFLSSYPHPALECPAEAEQHDEGPHQGASVISATSHLTHLACAPLQPPPTHTLSVAIPLLCLPGKSNFLSLNCDTSTENTSYQVTSAEDNRLCPGCRTRPDCASSIS